MSTASNVIPISGGNEYSAPSNKLTMAQAMTEALGQEMERDENILLMGEDIGPNGGVFRITEGLAERFGPDRVFDTPLAESGIVGTAIGLTVTGFRPVVEIQFMGFIYPAVNQIFAHAARLRNRTRGRFHVPMVIRMPYGGGIHPPEHHSESYESMLINTPGLTVVVPSNPHDAKGLLTAAIRSNDPVIFMEPKRIYRAGRQDVPSESYELPLGKAHVKKTGEDITVIAFGSMIPLVEKAAEIVEKARGISVEIIDLRTLAPMDSETFLSSVEKTGRAVVVHEAPRSCGIGGEIAAQISEHVLLHLLAPVKRVTGFDTIFPGAILESHYLPSVARIQKAMEEVLDY